MTYHAVSLTRTRAGEVKAQEEDLKGEHRRSPLPPFMADMGASTYLRMNLRWEKLLFMTEAHSPHPMRWQHFLRHLQRKRYGSSMWGLCLLYTSPSPRDGLLSRMPSSA